MIDGNLHPYPNECRHEFQCDGWTVDPHTSICRVCKQNFVFWSNPEDATSFTFPENAGSTTI
jgi:hypothetical protein